MFLNSDCIYILAYEDLIKENLFKSHSAIRCESTSPPQWTPPPPGVVLVNSDAAVFEALGRMRAGIIARNHQGTCLVSCRQQCLRLRRAVSLARNEGFDKVIFSTDCLYLVHRLHSSVMDRSSVALLVDGIKSMTNFFTSASFIHMKRNPNKAAHILAKSCGTFTSSGVFYSVPDCIRRTLCTDVN
jgi:hypothetical protein